MTSGRVSVSCPSSSTERIGQVARKRKGAAMQLAARKAPNWAPNTPETDPARGRIKPDPGIGLRPSSRENILRGILTVPRIQIISFTKKFAAVDDVQFLARIQLLLTRHAAKAGHVKNFLSGSPYQVRHLNDPLTTGAFRSVPPANSKNKAIVLVQWKK